MFVPCSNDQLDVLLYYPKVPPGFKLFLLPVTYCSLALCLSSLPWEPGSQQQQHSQTEEALTNLCLQWLESCGRLCQRGRSSGGRYTGSYLAHFSFYWKTSKSSWLLKENTDRRLVDFPLWEDGSLQLETQKFASDSFRPNSCWWETTARVSEGYYASPPKVIICQRLSAEK